MLELLKKSVKESPVVEMDDYHYFIHPLTDGLPMVERELLEEVLDVIENICNLDCDYIITAQSMGFPLATGLSLRTGLPYKFIRKRSYGLKGERSVCQITGYSECDLYINYVEEGDKVFFIDDVFSTGGTIKAIIKALQQIGTQLTDVLVIFEKIGHKEELEKELGISIKSLLRLDMKGPDIEIVGKGF